ncbi:zinc finger protein 585A-like [Eurosta solidaginis]|uniref:zinc finger protein 585A-like n=1 Tax=Eurosta solidaginis TaxID=178769 RepID=UPI0035305EE5
MKETNYETLRKMQKITHKNLHTFCRTCLEEFDDKSSIMGEKFNIQEDELLQECMALLCSSMPLLDDIQLPKFVCHKCYEKLKAFHDFRYQTMHSLCILNNLTKELNKATEDYRLDSGQGSEMKLADEICGSKNRDDGIYIQEASGDTNPTRSHEKLQNCIANAVAKILQDPIDYAHNHTSETRSGELDEIEINISDMKMPAADAEALTILKTIKNEPNPLPLEQLLKTSSVQDIGYDAEYGKSNEDYSNLSSRLVTKTKSKKSVCMNIKKSTKNIQGKKSTSSQSNAVIGSGAKFKCDQCPRLCMTWENYEAHLRTHQGLKPFVCEQCGRSFNKADRCRLHVREMHAPVALQYICTYEGCDKVFTREGTYQRHYQLKHKYVKREPRKFVCEVCGSTYTNATKFKEHCYKHAPVEEYPFKCNDCGKRYRANKSFKEHQLRHSGVKKFICPYCGMKKPTKYELRSHINSHTKERQWSCTNCSSVFSSSANLGRHLRVVHKGLREFACSYCDERFGKKETLRHHEMRHTGEKPHGCEICSKRFIQAVSLRTHMKVHNKCSNARSQSKLPLNENFETIVERTVNSEADSTVINMSWTKLIKMNKLSRNNLQEFCRTCLSSLQNQNKNEWEDDAPKHLGSNTNIGNYTNSKHKRYDLSVLPQVKKLFVLFTSLDIPKEKDEIYPRSLCQLCYDKIIDFQEFRNLAINSAEVLFKIVNNLSDDNVQDVKNARIFQQTPDDFDKQFKKQAQITQNDYQSNDDDDKLLLPELAPLAKQSIKSEPLDYNNASDPSSEVILPNDDCTADDFSKPFVKNEIDLEYLEDDDSLFNSISDDSDDQEQSLPIKNEADMEESRQRTSNGSTRKRDRNKRVLKCPLCDKQAYKQVYLDAHIRAIHEGHEKPFLCVECQKSYTRYDQLYTHIQSKHCVEQKFICGLVGCDASFESIKTLETHRHVVHTATSFEFQQMLELHQTQLSMEKKNEQWTCQLCLKNYSSKRALYDHQRRHSEVRNHICKVCGVGKVTSRELQIHMRTHTPNLEKFKCSLCPQEFNHKNAISRHVRVVHEGQRRFACNYCPKRFGTRNSQVCHERLHTGERPYNCKICHKSYPQIEGLKSHMKSHDKNLRKHVCSICTQRFITKKNLIDHEKRHQGYKPHICNVCSRGFFSAVDLEVHKRSHSAEEIRAEMTRVSYEAYQEQHANDSYEAKDVKEERYKSTNGRGSEQFLGYSSSMSSN